MYYFKREICSCLVFLSVFYNCAGSFIYFTLYFVREILDGFLIKSWF